jgi:cytochrome c biogenesis protein CcmG/thiol:disulfide interchange protein DsbE
MKRKLLSVFSVFAIIFICIASISCQSGTAAGKSKAPDFTLKDLDGNSFSLSSNARGKVVILDFWATWCPPCRAEIPHFVSLQDKYRNKGLMVIGISLDQGGVKTVKPFAKSYNINYPILMGNREVVASYGGVRSIPTTFVIDKKGRIVEKFVGYRSEEVFEGVIKKLL